MYTARDIDFSKYVWYDVLIMTNRAEYLKQWTKANPSKVREYQLKYRETHREQLALKDFKRQQKGRELILEHLQAGCTDCGLSDLRLLEFDHVPERGSKKFKISGSKNRPLGTLKTELAKCDVVCANCHAIRTYERRVNGRTPGL